MKRFIAISGVALACATGGAYAQLDSAGKPIRLLVGFAPGGATDVVARIVAPRLGELLGQQRIVIDNRSGAAQIVASELTAAAAPDGRTLFMTSAAFAINPALYKKLPFDSTRDFTPIVLTAAAPNVLVVHPTIPARSVKDLIALARSKPGQLLYGSAGVGAPSHLSGVLFAQLARVEITHVPYKGSSQAMTDLLGGQLQLSFPALSGAMPHIKSERLIPLGVTSRKRTPALPDVPAIEEAGLPGYEATSWFGLIGPARLPAPVVAKVNAAMNQALKEANIRELLARQGTDPVGGTPEQFAATISSDIERWKKVVAAAGIKAE